MAQLHFATKVSFTLIDTIDNVPYAWEPTYKT